MRTVKIPFYKILEWHRNPIGISIFFPVKVDWEELRLTESQIIQNSIARVNGQTEPYPDNSIFTVEVTLAS